MPIGALIGSLASLGVEALKLLGIDKVRKYTDQLTRIQLDILAEEEKGYDSDDAKIEHLLKEIKIVADAAKNDPALFAKSGPAA